MTDLTKRFLKILARGALSAICQLLGKATGNQEPGAGLPASRKPITNKPTKVRKEK